MEGLSRLRPAGPPQPCSHPERPSTCLSPATAPTSSMVATGGVAVSTALLSAVTAIATLAAVIWLASSPSYFNSSKIISALSPIVYSFWSPSISSSTLPADLAITCVHAQLRISSGHRVASGLQHAPNGLVVAHRADRVRAPAVWRRRAPPQWRAQPRGGEGACG